MEVVDRRVSVADGIALPDRRGQPALGLLDRLERRQSAGEQGGDGGREGAAGAVRVRGVDALGAELGKVPPSKTRSVASPARWPPLTIT